MRPSRPVLHPPCPPLPQSQQAPPRCTRVRKFPISLQQFLRRLPPVQTPQQNRRGSLHHGMRRIIQRIRQTHVSRILAQPNRMCKVRVRMKLHDKIRRPPFATKPRINPLENPFAAGHQIFHAPLLHEGFLRTGAGFNSFSALSTSVKASCVPSIASCKVSL